jgi:LmbE family N-acetylglucosaminyl deacetylase
MILHPPTGNCARFAARPLTVGGTAAQVWIDYLATAPDLDLTECIEIVVVAAHPDDETLGFGAAAATLAARGARVQVVVASDGGAAHPDRTSRQRCQLERTRRAELREATEVLGLPSPKCLGLPDGELSDHEGRLADLLSELLAGPPRRTWCAATWRGDGHRDHEAVGRAAAVATARSGAVLLEYPVWMWHWASPGEDAVPWDRLYAMPIADTAVARKAAAARCYRTQYEPFDADGAPVLPPFVLKRLLQVREVVFC